MSAAPRSPSRKYSRPSGIVVPSLLGREAETATGVAARPDAKVSSCPALLQRAPFLDEGVVPHRHPIGSGGGKVSDFEGRLVEAGDAPGNPLDALANNLSG